MTDEAPANLMRRGSDGPAEVEDHAALPAAKSLPCRQFRVHIGIIPTSAWWKNHLSPDLVGVLDLRVGGTSYSTGQAAQEPDDLPEADT